MHKTNIIAAALLVGALSGNANAQNRCPANDMGCDENNYGEKISERIEQGKQDVLNAEGVTDRVKAVRDTLNDCADCATKVLSDSVSRVTPEG